MELPEQATAKNWDGASVIDPDGEPLGRCTGVFADVDTGATEWVTVAVEGHRRLFIPALDATETGGTLRVRFARRDVLSAPHVGDDDELSKGDEVRLYEHYGVEHTSATSGSVLPSAAADLPSEVAPRVTASPASAPPTAEFPAVQPAKALDVPAAHVPPATRTPEAPVPVSTPAKTSSLRPEGHTQPPAGPRPPAVVQPRSSFTSGSSAAPLAVVAGIVAVTGIALSVWERRARRRSRPSARAVRARRQAKVGAGDAVHSAARHLSDAASLTTDTASRTARQLTQVASSATSTAARSGATVTSTVSALPPAVARRGRKARRAATRSIWDAAAVGTAGTGYVLGAKAGRGRYEQINQQAQELASSPHIKAVTESMKERGAARRPSHQ